MSAQMITSIYPADVVLPTTIIGALNGSSSMYIENQWFPQPLGKLVYNKEISEIHVFKDASKKPKKGYGTHFHTPRLLMRNGVTGNFTNEFTIRYGSKDRSLKDITVKKPFIKEGTVIDSSKFKVALTVAPNGIDRMTGDARPEDEIMLRIDQIYSMVLEFVLIATSAGFNGIDEKDNDKTLIAKLCAHIGAPGGEKNLDDVYYTFFEKPPIWDKAEGGVYYLDSTDPGKDCTLMGLVKMLTKRSPKSIKLGSSLKKLLSGDKRLYVVPCFKRYRYETKKKDANDDPIQNVAMEAQLKFHLQIPGVTPQKFPPILFTKTPKREQRQHIMDFDEYLAFFGSVDGDYTKAAWATSYEAAMFIGSDTEYSIFMQGQPKTQWYVETIIYKRQKNVTAMQSAFDDALFDDVDCIEEAAPVKTLSVDEQSAQIEELMEGEE